MFSKLVTSLDTVITATSMTHQVSLFKYNTTSVNYITPTFFGKLLYFADRNYNAQQIYINTCKYCKLILADAADADAADAADCFTITRPERFTSLRSLLRSSL